jgi:hypothetical protein
VAGGQFANETQMLGAPPYRRAVGCSVVVNAEPREWSSALDRLRSWTVVRAGEEVVRGAPLSIPRSGYASIAYRLVTAMRSTSPVA